MKKQVKYQNLPIHIYRQPNGNYKNIKTNKWVSVNELESYAVTEPKKKLEIQVKMLVN